MTPITPAGSSGDLAVDIAGLTRVEGEGSLRLRVRDGVVEEAHLEIFEAPRYFERLVVGRTPDEVIDIVARICGICPVAYQMTAVHAFEHGARHPDRSRRSGRCAACSTAASGSRATPSTSTCSTCPTSWATPSALELAQRPPRGGRVRAGPQEGRQPDRRAHRRAGDPPGLGPGRRLLAVVPPERDRGAPGPADRGARDRPPDGRPRRRPRATRRSIATPGSSRSATRTSTR